MSKAAAARQGTLVAACATVLWIFAAGDGAGQPAEPACEAVEETDFKSVAACMSLEELAAQLSAFNHHIGERLTGNTLEENVRAGLGTAMGVTANPERLRELQQVAQESGHPPLLSFADTERGVRTILPSSLAQSFTWNPDLVEAGGRLAARESAISGYTGILGPVADHSCTNRNGRSMETKGESPWLTALYVDRLVRGMQGDSLRRSGQRRGNAQALDRLSVRRTTAPTTPAPPSPTSSCSRPMCRRSRPASRPAPRCTCRRSPSWAACRCT